MEFHEVIKAALSEQEYRVLVKTSNRLNEEGDKSEAAGNAYLSNLTPVQREVLTKVVRLAKDNLQAHPRALEAFARYGIDV